MNVVGITSRTVKTYTLTIEGGEVRPQPYSRQGRQYRVARIVVIKSDGNVKVTLSGPAIKKDGADSLLVADEVLYQLNRWPGWLHSIVGGLA